MSRPVYQKLVQDSMIRKRRRVPKASPRFGKAGIPYLPAHMRRTGTGRGRGPRKGVVRPDLRKRVPGDEAIHRLIRGRAYTTVARVSGVPLRTVSRVLKGELVDIKMAQAVGLAAGLGCSVEELYRALVTLWTGQDKPVQVAVWWGEARGKGKVPTAAPIAVQTARPLPPDRLRPTPPAPVQAQARRPSALAVVETEQGYARPETERIGWGGRGLDDGYFED